jgi:hypothetical protein
MELTFLEMYFVKIRLQDKELDDGVINSLLIMTAFVQLYIK